MNRITFSPISQNLYVNQRQQRIAPKYQTFQGKNINQTQAKKTVNLAHKLYGTLFLPRGEKIKNVQDGYVYAQKFTDDNTIRISKKYKKWSKKPEVEIKDDIVTSIREKSVYNADGSKDLEIRDMYTPEYPVAIKYNSVKKDGFVDGGMLDLTYGDKQVILNQKEREEIALECDKILSKKYTETYNTLENLSNEEFSSYYSRFCKEPETIAHAILTSPASIKEHLELVPRALPYGIECIMDKAMSLFK